MKTLATLASLFSVTLLWLSLVSTARAGTAQHSRPDITPVKKDGKTVGTRIKINLMPEVYSFARVGLVAVGKETTSTTHRAEASDPSKGWLSHQFEVLELKPTETSEHTFKITYGENNSFKGGESLSLVTTFSRKAELGDPTKSTDHYQHVFGLDHSAYPKYVPHKDSHVTLLPPD